MFGSWASNTRKLNKHWQSNRRKGFWNMIKHITTPTSFMMKFIDVNYNLGFRLTKGDDKMYTIKTETNIKKGPVADADYDWDPKVPTEYIEKMDIVDITGEPFEALYDNDGKLIPGTTRFLGFQLSMIHFFGRPNAKYGNFIAYSTWSQMVPERGSGYNSGYVDEELPNQASIAYFKEVSPHDTSQKDNTEYIGTEYYTGHGLMGYLKAIEYSEYSEDIESEDVEGNQVIGKYTYKLNVTDNDFKNLDKDGSPLPDKRTIPTIGKTVFFANYHPGSTTQLNFVYFITPTVYDADGNIVELKK